MKILYGADEIEWEDLVLFAQCAVDNHSPNMSEEQLGSTPWQMKNELIRGMCSVSRIQNIRRMFQSDGEIQFDDLLLSSFYYKATKEVDYIYALQGLVSQTLPKQLQPNYGGITAIELYTRTTIHVLSGEDPYWILNFAGIGFEARSNTDLPSWTPDWSQNLNRSLWVNFRERSTLKLALKGSRYPGPSPHFEGGRYSLKTSAVWVDRVSFTCTLALTKVASMFNISSSNFLNPLQEALGEHMHLRELVYTRISDPYPTGESRRYALRCVLTPRSMTEKHSDSEDFDSWEKIIALGYHFMKLTNPNMYHDLKSRFPVAAGSLEADAPPLRLTNSELEQQIGLFGKARKFHTDYATSCTSRAFAITQSGYMALVPSECKAGDEIFNLVPSNSLYALRRVSRGASTPDEDSTDRFLFVGDCFIENSRLSEELNFDNLQSVHIV